MDLNDPFFAGYKPTLVKSGKYNKYIVGISSSQAEAKKQFAEESENNIYIDTIAAGLHVNEEPFDTPDLCHYDTESEVQLGTLFAENFKQFLD